MSKIWIENLSIKLNNTSELRSVTQCTSGSNIPCRPSFFKIIEQTCQVSRLCSESHYSESHIFSFWGFASLLERWTISNLHAPKVNLPGGRFAPSVPGQYILKSLVFYDTLCGLCKNIWVRFPYDPMHLLCMKQFHIFLTDSWYE